MNRLAIGTVQFGLPYGIANEIGQVKHLTAMAMLQLAENSGIDTLDTAIEYGESESCLGKIGVQNFNLVTKVPAIPENVIDVREWVQIQVKESLARLGVNSLYGLLLHRPANLLDKNGRILYQVLQDFKESGQVKKIGISIYSPSELEEIIPYYDFDVVQAPFNLLDRRLSTSGWLQRLNDLDIEVHARSVFLQGLLLMSKNNIPEKFSFWTELFNKWHDWLLINPISALQACLAYPLSFSEIDRVIVGADSDAQLMQIINAAQTRLSCNLPDLNCEDENLINPANWRHL